MALDFPAPAIEGQTFTSNGTSFIYHNSRWCIAGENSGVGPSGDADTMDGQTPAFYLDRANHTGTEEIGDVNGLQEALDLKAPLLSPALTGIPTAPTAAPGTNTAQVANTAFVGAAIAAAGGSDTGAQINAAPPKTTLVDADRVPLTDSAASFSLAHITWANLKATLLTWLGTGPTGAGSQLGVITNIGLLPGERLGPVHASGQVFTKETVVPFSYTHLDEYGDGVNPSMVATVDVARYMERERTKAFAAMVTIDLDMLRFADGDGASSATDSDSRSTLITGVTGACTVNFNTIHAGNVGMPWRVRLVRASGGASVVAVATANGITVDQNGFTIPNLGASVGDSLEVQGTILTETLVRIDGIASGNATSSASTWPTPAGVVTIAGTQTITGQKTINSPILVTPALGTPASGNLGNCTGYPIPAQPAASDTVAGISEMATTAETSTGTDATRAVTPAGLAASNFGVAIVELRLAGDTSNLTTGDGKDYWIVPSDMNGWKIESVTGHVITAGVTGATTFQVANVTAGVDVLSAVLSIASAAVDATGGTVNTSNNTLATNQRIRADCDSAATGTVPKGGRIYLKCRKS